MHYYYWNNWVSGWGWFLWFGIFLLMVASLGNWNYTYRAHRRFEDYPRRDAYDILAERYARGEISLEEFGRMRKEITYGYEEGRKSA